MDQAFGETAVAQIEGWERSVAEVSAYSTVWPEIAWVVDRRRCSEFRKRTWLKWMCLSR
jgi:hypothetical protein